MAGSSIQEIKTRGDWASDCVYLYLHVPLYQRIADDLLVVNLLAAVDSPA